MGEIINNLFSSPSYDEARSFSRCLDWRYVRFDGAVILLFDDNDDDVVMFGGALVLVLENGSTNVVLPRRLMDSSELRAVMLSN